LAEARATGNRMRLTLTLIDIGLGFPAGCLSGMQEYTVDPFRVRKKLAEELARQAPLR